MSDEQPAKGAYNRNEAAKYLGISTDTLRREIADGKVAVKYIRSIEIIRLAELESYLDSLPEDPA